MSNFFVQGYEFSLIEVIIFWLLSLFFFTFIVAYSGSKYRHDPELAKRMRKAYWYKMCLAFLYSMIHRYNMGGDTNAYFHDISVFREAFFKEPWEMLKILFQVGEVSQALVYDLFSSSYFSPVSQEFLVVRYGTIASVFGLGTYFGTTVVFSFFSFLGLWKLYLVFRRNYMALDRSMAFACLYIPSVAFWGSGILKDSITIGMLGFLLYAVDEFFFRKRNRFWALVTACIATMVIFKTKAYIIVAFFPALTIWTVYGFKDRIRIPLIRGLFVPFLIVAIMGASVGIMSLASKYVPKYALENLLASAQSMQGWHYVEGSNTQAEHGRGSSYTLGDYEPTLQGVLGKFIPAVNVTLFRPYPWEARNPAMMASAIESLIILLISIYLFFGIGVFKFFVKINQDAFLLMCLIFAIIFAFAVGFSSYNFGALVRYKVPCIPFYIASLFILNAKREQTKRQRSMEGQQPS